MSVILAQTRLLPRFLADQREDHWDFARSGALAGQTALIVGYGSIGAMVEPLLAAFGVTVERIDRRPATVCRAWTACPPPWPGPAS
jgi:phosphoglycerate dehydrogenase-like enzyme